MTKHLQVSRYGMVRIHLRARDRIAATGPWWRRLGRGRHLSHRIVQWAHQAGFPTAMVHRIPVGFVNHGPIIDDTASEHPNPHALMVVEINGPEAELQAFIERHRTTLGRAHISFHVLEHWSLPHPHHEPHAVHAEPRVVDNGNERH